MTQKIKVRITATHRRTVRITPPVLRATCPVCGREVEALTEGRAGEILEVDGRKLGALIASGRVHAIQTVNGGLRVCKESLFREGE